MGLPILPVQFVHSPFENRIGTRFYQGFARKASAFLLGMDRVEAEGFHFPVERRITAG
jgi:hypothetical protein